MMDPKSKERSVAETSCCTLGSPYSLLMESRGSKHLERRKRRAARKRRPSGPSTVRSGVRSRLRRWVLRVGLWIIALTTLLTLPLRWINPPTSSFILQRHFSAVSDHSPRVRYRWVDRQEIARSLAAAVQAAEDQKFRNHFGFDFTSIVSAIEENGGRGRGASTITQQVAKNLYLWPGRSLFRKGLEAYLSLALELFLPKDRILEVYLNLAEFGPNVFGAEAGSQFHFGKSASKLTDWESALFAAVLPNPARLSASRPSEYVRERANSISTEMKRF